MPSRFHRRKRRRTRRRKMPIVKLIKKVIHSSAEHKFNDFAFNATNVQDIAPVVTNGITDILQSVGIDDRIGLRVTPSRLKVRFGIQDNDSGGAINVRVYIVQNLASQNPNNMPVVGDLFPPLLAANNRYRVLYDKTFQFGLGLNRRIFREFNISGRKLAQMYWSSSAGNALELGRINLHVETNNTVFDDVSFQLVTRLYYTDD